MYVTNKLVFIKVLSFDKKELRPKRFKLFLEASGSWSKHSILETRGICKTPIRQRKTK